MALTKQARAMAKRAAKAVLDHARAMGAPPDEVKHVPLHYHMADLVSGLLLLAEQEGLDFEAVLKDAREVWQDTDIATKSTRQPARGTLLCAVHGTPVSPKESQPCPHCVRDFPTRRISR